MTGLSDTERETLANPLYDDYNEDVESIIGHACQGCPAKRIINGRARPGKCACPGTPDIRDNLAEAAGYVIAAREQAATLAERERLLGVFWEAIREAKFPATTWVVNNPAKSADEPRGCRVIRTGEIRDLIAQERAR